MESKHDDNRMTDGFPDEELEALFSAFDSVTASDNLKQSTLAAILEQGGIAYPGPDDDDLPLAVQRELDHTVVDEAKAPTATIVPFKPAKTRVRFRFIRFAAAIACAFALCVGGIAYAVPTSEVVLGDEEDEVVLHVNTFGWVVSSEGRTDEARAVLDEVHPNHQRLDDSVDEIVDAYERMYGREIERPVLDCEQVREDFSSQPSQGQGAERMDRMDMQGSALSDMQDMSSEGKAGQDGADIPRI